jgi:competence protein ComEC
MEPLKLANSKKEWFYLLSFLFIIIFFNFLFEYQKYKEFTKEELFQTNVKVLNIYKKEKFTTLKLRSDDFTFFTSVSKDTNISKLDTLNTTIITKRVTFFTYLKGFYTPTFNNIIIQKPLTHIQYLSSQIQSQHQNEQIGDLFNALFFAIPLNKEVQELCAIYGISHLVAISGFHLGILSFVVYGIFYLLYNPIHQKYFPYRNKKFDLLILTAILLFIYLLYINIVPSFLRAFVMFIFGLYFLRSNIKILSFQTLLIVVLFIIAIFPKLLFSLSLWFSVAGVFYIYLFIQYFKNLNKYVAFIFFNIWIYLAINPITHYFFGTTSLVQLFSPLFTVGFSLFYPLELFLHFVGFGGILDSVIKMWLLSRPETYEVFTPLWLFISYLVISFFAISSQKMFILLNIVALLFNLTIFYITF